MEREKPADQRCQHKFENGKQCDRIIDGRGGWRYCSECREAAQKKARSQRDAQRRRDGERAKDNYYHWLYDHSLTDNQLKPMFENTENPQEEYPHKDDFAEATAKKIEGIKELIIHPPGCLPDAAVIAREKTEIERKSLEERQQSYGPDPTITRLILATEELLCVIGMWDSGKALAAISGKAERLQALMFEHKETLGFIQALLVHVEILRTKYFATGQEKFLKKALTWLKVIEGVCDQAIARVPGERQHLAHYLRVYVDLGKVRLIFDAGDEGNVEQADEHLEAADQKAATFAAAYGEGQTVATARFLTSVSHAEYNLRRGNIDLTLHRLSEAAGIFPTMDWHSIESQHRIVSLNTVLALKNNDPEYQLALQNHLRVFDRYPCYQFFGELLQLKRTYQDQLAHVNLPKGQPKFLDVTYTHILPHLRYV
jgi:hypothetical protein